MKGGFEAVSCSFLLWHQIVDLVAQSSLVFWNCANTFSLSKEIFIIYAIAEGCLADPPLNWLVGRGNICPHFPDWQNKSFCS